MSRAARPLPIPKAQLVQLYRQALLADIPLDHITHQLERAVERVDVTTKYEQQAERVRVRRLQQQMPWPKRVVVHVLPVVCIVLGLFFVGNAVWPIAAYFLVTAPDLRAARLLAPIPADQVLDVVPTVLAQAQMTTASSGAAPTAPSSQPTVISDQLDYTNLANWFPGTSLSSVVGEQGVEYTIDIPAVEVTNAIVKLGGTNLDHNLIQYPGTSLPGEAGVPVIFGHSILRQFYNPSEKNPRRYFSIFSKIMTLKTGDKIYITHDNIKYTYAVVNKDVVKPEDTFILEQRFDVKRIKLVTCVPEGTYLERGVVTAELVN